VGFSLSSQRQGVALVVGLIVAIGQDRTKPFEVAALGVYTVAALAAVYYASDAARVTRSLRREERLARVPELAADLAEKLFTASGSSYPESAVWVFARASNDRLRAALAATGEDLPACEALMSLYPSNSYAGSTPKVSSADVNQSMIAAMDEIATRLRQ
jgi:hypothetical protein